MLVSDLASARKSVGWEGTAEGRVKQVRGGNVGQGRPARENGPTSGLGDDLKVGGQRPVSHRRVRQDFDVVGPVGDQALDGDEVGPPHDLLLPEVDVLAGVHGVVDPVAHDLPVSLLWLVPVDHGCGGAHHVTSDLPGRRAGRLLGRLGLDDLAGRPPADVVDRHHAELVVGVRAEAPHAVASGGHAVDLLVQVVRVLGLVLDDVVGHGFGISGIPGQRDAGGGALGHHGGPRSFGQRCGNVGEADLFHAMLGAGFNFCSRPFPSSVPTLHLLCVSEHVRLKTPRRAAESAVFINLTFPSVYHVNN